MHVDEHAISGAVWAHAIIEEKEKGVVFMLLSPHTVQCRREGSMAWQPGLQFAFFLVMGNGRQHVALKKPSIQERSGEHSRHVETIHTC
jgi:hypothetical protein